jgi:hypothetical protein
VGKCEVCGETRPIVAFRLCSLDYQARRKALEVRNVAAQAEADDEDLIKTREHQLKCFSQLQSIFNRMAVPEPMQDEVLIILRPRFSRIDHLFRHLGEEPQAVPEVAEPNTALLDGIAEGMAHKPFAKLDAVGQETVRDLAGRIEKDDAEKAAAQVQEPEPPAARTQAKRAASRKAPDIESAMKAVLLSDAGADSLKEFLDNEEAPPTTTKSATMSATN